MTQYDLYGAPARAVGVKDPAAQRQYLFQPRTIVALNSMAMLTGQSKEQIVNDAIQIYATSMSMLPEILDLVKNGSIQNLLGLNINR